jgi:hypothetical protein
MVLLGRVTNGHHITSHVNKVHGHVIVNDSFYITNVPIALDLLNSVAHIGSKQVFVFKTRNKNVNIFDTKTPGISIYILRTLIHMLSVEYLSLQIDPVIHHH